MATSTTSFGVSKPSTPFLLSGKNPTTRVATTGKFRKPSRPTSLSITNMVLDSSKPLNAATAASTSTTPVPNGGFISRFAPDDPRKGADVLVEALGRTGATDVFAYPGGASMEIHQALTRCLTVWINLCRHEQGEIFAAEGYARVSGRPGVCIANLVSGLADALLNSVPRHLIGTDAFLETLIVKVTRTITKHNYLVLDVEDIYRIVQGAFFLAVVGRPGPVLIDIPKDIQQQLVVPTWFKPMQLHGYFSRLPKPPLDSYLDQILCKKPVLYVGGGCLNSSSELCRFVEPSGIPVASTLMGLGAYPLDDPLSIRMLGMHGTVYENYAVHEADRHLAFGVRFDDPVTGGGEIVHIDFDRVEIWKNKQPHISVCTDLEVSLDMMNNLLEERIESTGKLDFSVYIKMREKKWCPLWFKKTFGEAIPPQNAIKVTHGVAMITTGVGQRQMWAAQCYVFKSSRQWATSSGLGAMGFGLPAGKRQMWAEQRYGFNGPHQWATSSGLGAMGFGLPVSIVVCAVIQKLGSVKFFLFITQKLLEIVQFFQTGM